jgi:cytochrome c551/c552
MKPISCFCAVSLGLLSVLLTAVASQAMAADSTAADSTVADFLRQHCVRCHGPDAQEGQVRVDHLLQKNAEDDKLWARIAQQIRAGAMPPEDEEQPSATEKEGLLQSLNARLRHSAPRLPNDGNLVPHELLFGKIDAQAVGGPPRVWRLNPEGYWGFVRDVHRGRADGVVQPFTLSPTRGIRDFSSLYSIDESSTEILLRNAEVIVAAQSAHMVKDGKIQARHDTVGEFVKLMDPSVQPTRQQLENAIQIQFRLALARKADATEVERLLQLYDQCAVEGDLPAAARVMLQAVLLRADAMYRQELGEIDKPSGQQRLAPSEIARCISVAILDRRDSLLTQAAEKGELSTKEQVAAHVQRLWTDPKREPAGVYRFFREYFEYHKAVDVFKDKPKSFVHEPRVLVSDTDRLVKHIVAEDRDVFRQLLTTRLSFVNYHTKENKQTRQQEPVPAVTLNAQNNKGQTGVESVYGIDEFPKPQPTELPANQRMGILMQPSWLAAFSTNFDNDPVRRGRWIRERLLGGVVPDLPIGVVAQVPDEPQRTLRDRLQVTREGRCWKCHQQMDDLGLPFENFDHYGRFRTAEEVLDVAATEKNVDKKGQTLGPVHTTTTLITQGLVARSGDASLDGPIADPREFMLRLANSDRTRQVFVRHAFRYFLGRNESLADAASLQAADRAYVESDGSFRALVTALFTSDSFLLRRSSTDSLASTAAEGTTE